MVHICKNNIFYCQLVSKSYFKFKTLFYSRLKVARTIFTLYVSVRLYETFFFVDIFSQLLLSHTQQPLLIFLYLTISTYFLNFIPYLTTYYLIPYSTTSTILYSTTYLSSNFYYSILNNLFISQLLPSHTILKNL